VSWFNVTIPVPMMKAGRVRALAIAAEQRLPKHDSVPTLTEIGFPGVRAAQWVAAFAPAGVPAEIIEVLRKSMVGAMGVAERQQAFMRGDMILPRKPSLADPKVWLQEEMASWKRDIDDTGIVIED
jgi:tripartite-type tricarboxylate transporter receptor subunit TctC